MAEVAMKFIDLLATAVPTVQVQIDVEHSEDEKDKPATLAMIYALTVHRLVQSGDMNALSRRVCADLYPRLAPTPPREQSADAESIVQQQQEQPTVTH